MSDAELTARIAALEASLRWFLMLQPREGEDAIECFERVAAEFHRATGYLRPGKDCRIHSSEVRFTAWEEWVAKNVATARAALAPQPAPTPQAEAVPVARDDDAEVLATYDRKDGRRDWVSVGCWLRPGEEIVHRSIAAPPPPAPVLRALTDEQLSMAALEADQKPVGPFPYGRAVERTLAAHNGMKLEQS